MKDKDNSPIQEECVEQTLENTAEPTESTDATEKPTDEVEVIDAPEELLETQLAVAQDRHKRTLAEFDNFRKRTTKEMSQRYEDGLRAAAEKLLPIIDNFDRAMASNENKEDTFYQGIALISRQFEGVLQDIGIEPITDQPGTSFDHNLHHAVAHIEDEAYGQNEIVEILQKGYKHRDKVLRPSMVKVAN